MLILAGREPTSGTVERLGAVGLGQLGGTAVIMQHPESQNIGTGVADDVVWGLPPARPPMSTGCSMKSGWTVSQNAIPVACPAGNCSALRWLRHWRREPALLLLPTKSPAWSTSPAGMHCSACYPVCLIVTAPLWCTSPITTARPISQTAQSISLIRRM